MIFLILGPQGSGKGTQAKLLAKKLGYHYFESGDVCREKAKEKSSLGRKINRILNQEGTLVPDQIMKQIVGNWLAKINVKKGVVFDGYPRNLLQYQIFEKMLAEKGLKVDKVIYLKVSRDTSIKRLLARRICPQCDTEYNLITKLPKNDELCDKCQIKLIQRQDDSLQLIEKRLKTYYRLTQPLVNSVRQKRILEELDGERPIEPIHQDIMKRLKR